MRRTLAALVTALLLAAGVVLSQGPLTPFAMLRGRTDSSGSLRVEGQAYSGTQGPLTNLANLRVRTDSNGSLLVSIAGGDITPDTITFPTGGAVRTGTTASDTFLLQGYDTNTGPAYVTLATVTAGTTPTIAIPAITGATTFSANVSLLSDAGLLYFGASSDNAIGRADASSLYISKGLHIGGTSAVADNNMLVDGLIVGTAGTAGAPSFTFVGDENTGMYSSGADYLEFTTGGTRRMYLFSGGMNLADSATIVGTLTVSGAGTYTLRNTEANTGAKTTSVAESFEVYTNTGDGDGSSIALVNDPTVGTTYGVLVTVAQTITITPSSGESLYLNGAACAVSITSATVGSSLTVTAATGGAGGVWIATSTGTWACNS